MQTTITRRSVLSGLVATIAALAARPTIAHSALAAPCPLPPDPVPRFLWLNMSRGPWITSVRHSHRLHWYIHKARRGLHNTELHFEHSHRILTREELADLPPDVRTLYAEIPPWALANDLRCVSNGRRSLENFCKRNST